MNEYDLIIIGGGAAAFAAAHTANTLRKTTLMIHDPSDLPLGGTCVNVGCIPSKILLRQGEEYYYSTRSPFSSFSLQGAGSFLSALQEARESIALLRTKKYEDVLKKHEYVTLMRGRASLIGPNTVRVGGTTVTSKFILIATGASPFIPLIPGLDTVQYYTHRTILHLEKTPRSVIILGGGPQAMEFSQIFHHFGISVTILQRSDRILEKFEPILGYELKRYLEEEGISIHTNVHVEKILRVSDGIRVTALIGTARHTFQGDLLFLATGITPNTQGLHCDAAGVECDAHGFIRVNEYMQTSQKTIYAAGDVTGIRPLETVAAKQGSLAVYNMFTPTKRTIAYDTILQAVFTSPQVASVGITEEDYSQMHGSCLCSTVRLDQVEKAQVIRDTRGLIKMVLDHTTKCIVGVHIIAPFAAEIITPAVYAIRNRMTIYDVRDTVHIFPTLSEMIKKVAQSFEYDLDGLACCVE